MSLRKNHYKETIIYSILNNAIYILNSTVGRVYEQKKISNHNKTFVFSYRDSMFLYYSYYVSLSASWKGCIQDQETSEYQS